jgi:hypothetical protein
VRRLGIKVPVEYVRIKQVKILPDWLVEKLVKYPTAVMDDEFYKADEEVQEKY